MDGALEGALVLGRASGVGGAAAGPGEGATVGEEGCGPAQQCRRMADSLSDGDPPGLGLASSEEEGRMGAMPGPLDPLELALLLEAAEDVSGLDRDETAPVDEADDGDEDDREP